MRQSHTGGTSGTLTHVLFDFFGTLVAYTNGMTIQGFRGSYAVLQEAGTSLSYGDFLSRWSATFSRHELRAQETHREFPMEEPAREFLEAAVPAAERSLVERFVQAYLREWDSGVSYLPGLSDFLDRLSRRYTLAVVTNTHAPGVVHGHLRRMDAERFFQRVVTSMEYGRRKPAPDIFHHAMGLLGAVPACCLYVGDTYEADYLGARSAGISALLIDPAAAAPVAEHERMDSLFALERRLAG